jgi:hypothetical protein
MSNAAVHWRDLSFGVAQVKGVAVLDAFVAAVAAALPRQGGGRERLRHLAKFGGCVVVIAVVVRHVNGEAFLCRRGHGALTFGPFAGQGGDGDGVVVVAVGRVVVIQATQALALACHRGVMVLAVAVAVIRRACVVGVISLHLLCRLLLIGRLLQALGPAMFRQATRGAVNLARCSVAAFSLSAVSRQLSVAWLVVAFAVVSAVAMHVFVAVALHRSAGGGRRSSLLQSLLTYR